MMGRVLITTHAFLPEIGGNEIYVAQIADVAKKGGWEPTVYAQMPRGKWWPSGITQGISTHRFFTPPLAGRLRSLVPAGTFRTNRKWSPGMARPSLYRDFDVIYALRENVFPSDVVLWHKFHRRIRTPVVFFPLSRSGMHPTPVRPDPYYTRFLPKFVHAAEFLHTCTESETAEYVGMGYPRERIRELPLGVVDDEFVRPRTGASFRERFGIQGRFILYAGGLYYNKRFDTLMRAFASVASKHPSVKLVSVGRVGDAVGAAWKDQAQRLLGSRVVFTGPVDRGFLLDAYAASEFLCLPSEFEGFGMVTVEAMATGKPFVACTTGIAPEYARRGFGLVSVPGDVDAMARNLDAFLEDPSLAAEAGKSGKAFARRELLWSALGPRYVKMFEEAAQSR